MPFPGEGLGSTMCGGWISQQPSPCYTNSHMLPSPDKDWTWEDDETRKNGWGCTKLYTIWQ